MSQKPLFLPLERLHTLDKRVRIAVGDQDRMVSIEESLAACRQLPHGEFQVLPATPHPIDKIIPSRLISALSDFFGGSS